MSEKLTGHEHYKPKHTPESAGPEHVKHHHETKHSKHEHQDNLDDIQRSIELHAKKSHETVHHRSPEASQGPSDTFVNKELKIMAFERTMHRLRRNLSPINRTASKVIHNQTVDKASELGAKTIARPSAILGAGVLSALGGLVYFWICKHFGYEYNATVLLLLFSIGFGLGLLIELIKKLAQPRV